MKFRNKIKTLRKILKQYALYFRYFEKADCFVRGKNIVITFTGSKGYDFLRRKFPKRETEKVIKRYRSKLHSEMKKHRNQIRKQKLLRQRTRFE